MANYDSTHTGATIDSAVSQVTDSTTDFNVDSNTLVVDKSANSVGIGIAAPASALHIAGTMQVGADGSGQDVIFYSDTSGDNLTWDASEECLIITGTDAAQALKVADGDLVVVDKIYLYDNDGDEHISADASGVLSIAAGAEIDLSATAVDLNGTLDVSGTLTMGGNILMADDTSIGIADDAERIEFDSAGDISLLGCNVGIGTTSPASTVGYTGTILDISGSSVSISLTDTGSSSNWEIGAHSGYLRITDDDVDRFFIQSATGNVGIGTTAPAKALHVVDSALIKGRATFTLTGSIDPAASTTVPGVGTLFLTEVSIGDDIVVSGETRTVTAIASNTSLTVNTAFSNNANDATPDCNPAAFTVIRDAGAIGMVLDDNGNVGIGNAAPASKLDISGVFKFYDDNTPEIHIVDPDDSNYALIGYSDGTLNLSSNHGNEVGGANVINFATDGGTVRMKLDDNSRISLSNNDVSSSTNTIFGKLAFNTVDSNELNNVVIGEQAGELVNADQNDNNVYIGYQAATGGTGGRSDNVAIGYRAWGSDGSTNNTGGNENTFIGSLSGNGTWSTAGCDGNTGVGYGTIAGALNGAGNNTAVGKNAMATIITGDGNVAIGGYSMDDTDAHANTGASANNVFVGHHSGGGTWAATQTDNAIGIGAYALYGALDNVGGTVAIGGNALQALTSGAGNTAVGYGAGLALTTGTNNVIMGYQAFDAADRGESGNVAIGTYALGALKEGTGGGDSNNNVAIGYNALLGGDFSSNARNLDGNIAIGANALTSTSTNASTGQIAIGDSALTALTSGARNTAVGYQALDALTVGNDNIALGYQALKGASTNASCIQNIAIGSYALDAISTNATNSCVGIGHNALTACIADNNTAIGSEAGNEIVGGANNTIIGAGASGEDGTASNQTVIGKGATGVADNSVTLGDANVTAVYMASDSGATVHCGRIDVEGDLVSDYVAYIKNDGDNANRYGMKIQCGADDASGTNYAIGLKDGDGGEQGYITFSGGTVTYGAFTANHDVELPSGDNDDGYPHGTLVEHTEIFYKQKDGADSERGILYKVQKSSSAYAKNVLGAYAGKYSHDDNLHQVYVLGDGHILCNGEKGNIAIGDGICTSSTGGQGMKADKMAMCIGIAQEAVTFSGSESKLVAVQYGLQQFTPWE